MAGQQVLPARGGGFGQARVGLFLHQAGVGLRQLLVKVRAVDFGEDLPGFDLGTDVGFPVFQVAADPRVNRRLAPGLKVRGQAQGVAGHVLFRLEHHHLRDGGGFGPGGDRLFVHRAGVQAVGDQQGGQCQAADTHEHQTLARGVVIRRHVKFLQQLRE